MLGVFAKVLRDQPIKTRLQRSLTRLEAEAFYLASLADTLETASRVTDSPNLILQGGENADAIEELGVELLRCGMDPAAWKCLRVSTQAGADLGQRLEHAFTSLFEICTRANGVLIIGSDSPSLGSGKLRRGLESLQEVPAIQDPPALVLGPTADGGYWAIGLRRPVPGLLQGIEWSTERTMTATRQRATELKLKIELLDSWTDVDHPEDLHILGQQIQQLRHTGDLATARHCERVLQDLGVL